MGPGGQLRSAEGCEWEAGGKKKTNRTKGYKSAGGMREEGALFRSIRGGAKSNVVVPIT